MKFIIYNPKTNLFDFFIDSLIYELNKRNLEAIVIKNIQSYQNIHLINKTDILFIIINPHFIINNIDLQNDVKFISNHFKYKIFYISEPINFIVEKKVYQNLINTINPFVIWTYTFENFNKLKLHQPLFNIYPIYNHTYNFIDITLSNISHKNINKIVFIGNITDNRKDICDSFNDLLINYDDSWTKDEWSIILQNNLFYLNIHRRVGCKSFESFRIIPILANGGFIISERCNEKDEELYSNYNIIFVERQDLLSTFLKYNNSCNYQDIYNNAMRFRHDMNNNNIQLNNFFEYFNKIII